MVEINPISFDSQPIVQQNPLLDPRLQQLLAQKQAKTLSEALLAQATAQTPIYSTRAGLAKMLQGGLAGYSEGLDLKKAADQQVAMGKVRNYATGMLGGEGLPPGATPATGKENEEAENPPATGPAPTSSEDGGTPGPQASAADPEIENRFIGTLKAGGLTNPNGLAAVAAYGNAESSYDPENITGSWSDKSQSGQPGTSGGALSWRNERLANMRAATKGAEDPVVAQAQFFLKEDPQLTAALQNAKSPDEAHSLMANAWKFAGYDSPGGENARRLQMTRQYLGKVGGGAQTAQADGDLIPNPNGYDTSLLPPGVQPGTGASPDRSAMATALRSSDASPNAVTGGAPMPARPSQGPGSVGPNGGTMSAPTNRGASMEMLPLQQGGGFAPAPPPRPQAQQMAAALQGGSPLSAAQGKLAYAGNGPIMSDAPPPGVSPGLSAPPPGFQPQGPQDGQPPVKEAATRTLVGPSPVITDGQPVNDPQANPATGKATVLPKAGSPQQEPPGIANAGRQQPVDAGQAVAQMNMRQQAQKAQMLQAAAALGQSGNAADKAIAEQLVKRATSQQTGMYAWNGGIMYKDANGAPQWFLRPSEMNGSWTQVDVGGVPHIYNKDSANPRATLVPLVDPKAVQSKDLTEPTMKDKDGNTVMNPNYVAREPGKAAVAPFRSGVSVTNTNTVDKGESKFDEEMGKGRAAAALEIEAAGRTASGQMQRLAMLRSLLDNATPGSLANAHSQIVGLAQSFGVSDERLKALGLNPNQAISDQVATKLTNELTVAAIGKGGFPANNFSDADRGFLRDMFPKLSNQPGANKLAIDVMMKVEERKQQVSDAWADYRGQMAEQGKRADFDVFERKIARALRGNDMFGDIRKEVEAMGIKGTGGTSKPLKIERNGVTIEQME